jgi:hypothetical protein
MSEGPYTPARPDSAECPHCGAAVDGAAVVGRHLWLATLILACPGCGRQWSELRKRGEVARYWDPDKPTRA